MKGKGKKEMKLDTVALAQCKANERKAAEYVARNERKRKIEKRKKAVIGTVVAAFFIVSCGVVENDYLESKGVKRIILPREMRKEEINNLKAKGLTTFR